MKTDIFFSILLPTRDRPELVDLVLRSLTNQSYKAFEIILSDNFIDKSCKHVYEKYSDCLDIKYIRPEFPLSMANNYQFALSFSRGDYICVLEDKTLLYPFALEKIKNKVLYKKYPIINFNFDAFHIDENTLGQKNIGKLYYNYYQIPGNDYRPVSVLKNRLKFRYNYEKIDSKFKRRGKILIGCCHRDLINRIQKKYGRVFYAHAPDYSSLALSALTFKEKCYDFGVSLGIALKSDKNSNGIQSLLYKSKAEKFIYESDPKGLLRKYFPFSEYYFLQANMLAADFNHILSITGKIYKYHVDVGNLVLRCYEELKNFKDIDLKLINEFEKKYLSQVSTYTRLKDKILNYMIENFPLYLVTLNLKIKFSDIFYRLFKIKLKYFFLSGHRRYILGNDNPSESVDDAVIRAEKYYKSMDLK